MVEEIKATILTEKGEEWYNQYYAKPEGEREAIGFTVSFDMGWNKRSSGHKYDSISGHAFIIGVYTRRIIDYVVFSKSCSICNARNKKNKHADKHGCTVVSNTIIAQEIESEETNDDDLPASGTSSSPNADAARLLSICRPLHATGTLGSASASGSSPSSPSADAARLFSICRPLHATGTLGSASASGTSSSSPNADAARLPSICSPLHATGTLGSASANIITPPPLDAAAFLKGNRRQREPITTNVIDVSLQDQFFTNNYDGSSGGMASDRLLLIMIKLYLTSVGKTFLDTVVTDDDTKMKKHRL